MINAKNATCSRIGIEPHYAAVRGQPFDPVVQPACWISKRPVDIGKTARVGASDMRQDAIQRHGFCRYPRVHEPPLRRCRTYGQQQR
jgi:hypothetical protein